MNPVIANREFKQPEDGWFQLIPLGEFPVRIEDREFQQVLDEAAHNAIVAAFNRDRTNPNFSGLLLDFEHWSYDTGRSSEAAGWVTELERRDDGTYGRIDFSDTGTAAVSNGRYKHASPVWLPDDVEILDAGRIRPLRLDSVGLTNQPNLRGMVPFSNSKTRKEFLNRAAHNKTDEEPRTPNEEQEIMQAIAKQLGLAAEASEEDVAAAITQLQQVANAANEPIENRAEFKALQAENERLTRDLVDADMDRFGSHLVEGKKDAVRAALLANRKTGLTILTSLAPAARPQPASRPAPALNRSEAKPPADSSPDNSERQKFIANRQRHHRSEGKSARDAFDMAKADWEALRAG